MGKDGQYTIQIIRCATYRDFDEMHLPFVKYLHQGFREEERVDRNIADATCGKKIGTIFEKDMCTFSKRFGKLIFGSRYDLICLDIFLLNLIIIACWTIRRRSTDTDPIRRPEFWALSNKTCKNLPC